MDITGSIQGERDVLDRLGYKNQAEFNEAMKDQNIDPRIDFTEARLTLDVPSNVNQPGLLRGRQEGMTTIYYSPDIETQDVLDAGQAVNLIYNDPKSYGSPVVKGQPLVFGKNEYGQTTVNGSPLIHVPNGRGGHTGDAIFIVGEGSIKGNDKTIYVIDVNDPQKEPRVLSLEDMNTTLTEQIDVRWNNYEGPLGTASKEK